MCIIRVDELLKLSSFVHPWCMDAEAELVAPLVTQTMITNSNSRGRDSPMPYHAQLGLITTYRQDPSGWNLAVAQPEHVERVLY